MARATLRREGTDLDSGGKQLVSQSRPSPLPKKSACLPLEQLKGLKLTGTSLEILHDLLYAEWLQLLLHCLSRERSWQWAVGDALAYGEGRFITEGPGAATYGEVSEALEANGFAYSPGTLRNWARVSRNVDPSRRRDDLPWSRHEVVAKLPPERQREALALIAANGWTVRTARLNLFKPAEAGGVELGHSAQPRTHRLTGTDTITIPVARYRRWELLEQAVAAIMAVEVTAADGIVGVPAELFARLAEHYANDPTPLILEPTPATMPDPPPAEVQRQEQLFVLPRKPHYA
jgi:hypothetical protein